MLPLLLRVGTFQRQEHGDHLESMDAPLAARASA